jgi:hypothetical protein
MRWMFGLLVFAAAAGAGGDAHAARWCAQYDWTTSNCGFQTLEQCLATISGIGGDCRPDLRDDGRSRAKQPRERRKRRQIDQR